jgi:hypothetical protein
MGNLIVGVLNAVVAIICLKDGHKNMAWINLIASALNFAIFFHGL